jgi:hypothetical protein
LQLSHVLVQLPSECPRDDTKRKLYLHYPTVSLLDSEQLRIALKRDSRITNRQNAVRFSQSIFDFLTAGFWFMGIHRTDRSP